MIYATRDPWSPDTPWSTTPRDYANAHAKAIVGGIGFNGRALRPFDFHQYRAWMRRRWF